MSMSPAVQAEYDKILATVTARNGYVLKSESERSQYTQYDYTSHMRKCALQSSGTPHENSWYEFQGTFADDHTVHGILVTNVTCNCGEITDRTIRWRVSVSEAIQLVFEELYRQLKVEVDETHDKAWQAGRDEMYVEMANEISS